MSSRTFDELVITVNLKDELVSKDGRLLGNCDSKGNFYFSKSAGGIWRIGKDMNEIEFLGGTGTRQLNSTEDRASLQQAKLDVRDFVEVEPGVFWCLGPRGLLHIDTESQQVKMVLESRPSHSPAGAVFGYFPSSSVARLSKPNNLVTTSTGSTRTVFLFSDGEELQLADKGTKGVERITTISPNHTGYITDPTSLKPSPYFSSGGSVAETSSLTRNWAWVLDLGGGTYLMDLRTGRKTKIYDDYLRPLFTIEPFLTLAIATGPKGESRICLVNWSSAQSIPSDMPKTTKYLLTSSHVRTIKRLPGPLPTALDKPCVIFNPVFNRLFLQHDSKLLCYCDIFSIASSTGSTIYPKENTACRPSFEADLSRLLSFDCHLSHDLQIHHSASNSTWKVHLGVLRLHDVFKTQNNVDSMTKVIEHSSLPSSSIEAFLSCLYFSFPSSLPDSFMPICHCLLLCNQIGVDSIVTQHLLWLLETKIVPVLLNPLLLKNIMTLWFIEQDSSPQVAKTYSATSPVMSILASRCRTHISQAEIDGAIKNFDFSKVTLPVSQLMGLGISLSNFLSSNSSIELVKPTMSSSPPSIASQPLTWDEKIKSSSSLGPPKDSFTFTFTIQGRETGGVVCNALLLYPQWKWFERLVKVGPHCDEVKTQHVVMPTAFTPDALIAILSVPHGTYRSSKTLQILSTTDLAIIYRFMGEFQLPDSPKFAKFVKICKTQLFSDVNEQNCIFKLHAFWAAGLELNSELFLFTLALVVKTCSAKSMEDILELPLQLITIIYAYRADPEQFKASNFSSVTTDLRKSLAVFQS